MRIRRSVYIVSFLIVGMVFGGTACSSTTDNIPEENQPGVSDVWYQVEMSEGVTAVAQYYRGGGITTAYEIPSEWESDIYTVEPGTEMRITVTGEAAEEESNMKISIFADGESKVSKNMVFHNSIGEPMEYSVQASYVVGE